MENAVRLPDDVFFEHLDELLELGQIDFGPICQRVLGEPEFEPGTVLETDRVVSRGTGRYHQAKRGGAK